MNIEYCTAGLQTCKAALQTCKPALQAGLRSLVIEKGSYRTKY